MVVCLTDAAGSVFIRGLTNWTYDGGCVLKEGKLKILHSLYSQNVSNTYHKNSKE